MLILHIFSVVIATIILIIFAESQRLRKISYILVIGCIGYIILIIIPEPSNSYTNDTQVNSNINDDMTIEDNINSADEDSISLNGIEKEYELVESIDPIQNKFQQELIVNSIAMTTEITDREPINSARLFLNDIDHLYCFTSVNNLIPNNKIVHHWYSNNIEYFQYTIDIGESDNWRCWSRIAIKPELAGEWKMSITDTLGYELRSIEFTILPTEE